jgi:hypothetical protein
MATFNFSLFNLPDQRSTLFSVKKPVRKYVGFELEGSCEAAQLCWCVWKQPQALHKQIRVTVFQLYLWLLKFEFHIIFRCREMFFLLLTFFEPFKDVKNILGSQIIQKQVADWMWFCRLKFANSCFKVVKSTGWKNLL